LNQDRLVFVLLFRFEKCFILTGLALPIPSQDIAARQAQLLTTVKDFLNKLDPSLAVHELQYVRVIRGPSPSILEVECAKVEG
jgi:hypothetical protein